MDRETAFTLAAVLVLVMIVAGVLAAVEKMKQETREDFEEVDITKSDETEGYGTKGATREDFEQVAGMNAVGKKLACKSLTEKYTNDGEMCGFPVMRDGNMNIGRRLHFSTSTSEFDPTHFQKVQEGADESNLRLTINDGPNETFQIWGNACGSSGGCAGEGEKQHQFKADGDTWHRGQGEFGKGIKLGGGSGVDESQHYAFANTEQDSGYPHHLVNSGRTVLRWDRNNTGNKSKEFTGSGRNGNHGTFYYKDPDSGEFRYLLDTGNVRELEASILGVQQSVQEQIDANAANVRKAKEDLRKQMQEVKDDTSGDAEGNELKIGGGEFIAKKLGGYSKMRDQIILLCKYGAYNDGEQNVIGTLYHNRTTGWNTGIIMNVVYSQTKSVSGGNASRYTAALSWMGGNRGGISASMVSFDWNGASWVGVRIRAGKRYWPGNHFFMGYNLYKGPHQFEQVNTGSASNVRDLDVQPFEVQGSIKTHDKLCIGDTCLTENDIKVLKGDRPFTMRSNRTGRRLQDGSRNAQFQNHNRMSWEWMYLEGQ